MPLAITTTGASWSLAARIAAPTSAQLAGVGGPAQSLVTGLLVVNAGASWKLAPLIPTTGQLSAALGPGQGYTGTLILVGVGADWKLAGRIAQPKLSAQRGAGGPAQANATGLIVVGTAASWNLAARLFAARFTFTISSEGVSVAFASSTGDSPETFAWDFGDKTTGEGAMPAHVYSEFGSYVVTLTARRTRGFEKTPLESKASRTVEIVAAAQPDESLADVLNLEVGFHAYEPIRDHPADAGENVSFHNQVLNLAVGQLASLLFFTPAQAMRVRQVTVTGSGDGLFKLILNGRIIDVKRTYATQRNVRFDIEEGLKLTVNDTLEVQVTNASTLAQSYDAAILGRTV